MAVPDVVLDIISDILACDRNELRSDQHLFRDLRMDSDDASFVLVPKLERALGVEVSKDEWRAVNTIQDVVDLVQRYKLS